MGKLSNHCHISKYAKEWIEGELLGDGHLMTRSYLSARFDYTSKHEEYIHYVSDTLAEFGIQQTGKIRAGVNCYYYASRSYIDLFDIWVGWYALGKKEVPKDLKLTPIVCRQWYIGDGSLLKPGRVMPSIRLATCGFFITDVLWLISELKQLGFLATYQQNNNGIYISAYSTKKFLDYIGECPVKCYKYKWRY